MPTQPLPDDLLAALRDWGPRWHHDIAAGRDAMFEAWAPLHARADRLRGLAVQRDLAYGSDPRQMLDVYAPERARDLPVMIFVHGGAFVRGDKDQTPWLYSNVCIEFARQGFIACNVEYRLAPDAAWPAGAEDVRDAVLWIAEHIAQAGGAPGRSFLMSHSASCAHCATAAWDDRVRPAGGLPIAGLLLLSPRVVADVRPENPNAAGVRAYYGDDPAQYVDRAPLDHARADAPPTLIAAAQYENPLIDFYAFELAHRLAQLADCEHAPMPRLLQLPQHNHLSLITQFDTPHNRLGADIRDWCAQILDGAYAA